MKYRLVKRARGWVVQYKYNPALVPEKWFDRACWKFRWCALLHLLWLRERARK